MSATSRAGSSTSSRRHPPWSRRAAARLATCSRIRESDSPRHPAPGPFPNAPEIPVALACSQSRRATCGSVPAEGKGVGPNSWRCRKTSSGMTKAAPSVRRSSLKPNASANDCPSSRIRRESQSASASSKSQVCTSESSIRRRRIRRAGSGSLSTCSSHAFGSALGSPGPKFAMT